MAEAPRLKDQINAAFLQQLAALLHQQHATFPTTAFDALLADPAFEQASLMQRIQQVADSLWLALALPFPQAMKPLKAISEHCKGLPALCLPQIVADHGLAHVDDAMQALAVFTRDSTAEFAIRPFLQQQPDRCLRQLQAWAQHPDPHLRRLASEGSRPRLPWGQSLRLFKREPWHTWPILATLMTDPSLYVRRSVANHCNDISKDHPDWLLDQFAPLRGTHPHTDWIIRHALRDLLKKRHPRALAMIGFAPVALTATIELASDTVQYGEALVFNATLDLPAPVAKLRVEFGIDFVGAKGQPRTKVFQWVERQQAQGQLQLQKQYLFSDRTTRKHYAGRHQLRLIINGQIMANSHFDLIRNK